MPVEGRVCGCCKYIFIFNFDSTFPTRSCRSFGPNTSISSSRTSDVVPTVTSLHGDTFNLTASTQTNNFRSATDVLLSSTLTFKASLYLTSCLGLRNLEVAVGLEQLITCKDVVRSKDEKIVELERACARMKQDMRRLPRWSPRKVAEM